MYGIPDQLKALSSSEEQVLLALWAAGPRAARREIGEQLPGKHWADATILNFLYRMEAKGWVKSEKEGNRNLYTPTITRRAYGVYCMKERLETLFGGDLPAAVRALVSESSCTQGQLEQAVRVLEEKYAEAGEYDFYD